MTDQDSVTIWFDPTCPFTWRTSRWLHNVNAERPTTVNWRFLSLTVLNEGNEPGPWEQATRQGHQALRVLAAAAAKHGPEVVGPLYTALGTRRHEDNREYGAEVFVEALTEVGLPTELAAAADDEAWDKPIRASHAEAQSRVGQASGSPVVAIGDGPGFFGPVVGLAQPPSGVEAVRLFDAIALLSGVPQFSELKRGR